MSTVAQRLADYTRRRAILAVLAFAPGRTASARTLRDELEGAHGQVATVDRVRADMIWLADVGLVERQDDLAKLTETGADVVMQRAEMPGGG